MARILALRKFSSLILKKQVHLDTSYFSSVYYHHPSHLVELPAPIHHPYLLLYCLQLGGPIIADFLQGTVPQLMNPYYGMYILILHYCSLLSIIGVLINDLPLICHITNMFSNLLRRSARTNPTAGPEYEQL